MFYDTARLFGGCGEAGLERVFIEGAMPDARAGRRRAAWRKACHFRRFMTRAKGGARRGPPPLCFGRVEQAGQSRGQGAAAEMNRKHGKLSASTFKKLPLSHFVYSPLPAIRRRKALFEPANLQFAYNWNGMRHKP
ncbi:MAG: hypothetical protein LBD58_01770 [Treponema sp.]|nr:hypothetical protein [Treponema sp.]